MFLATLRKLISYPHIAMSNNLYKTGQEVTFSYGLTVELSGGMYQQVQTSPAMIIVAGAKFDGEWMYFDAFNPSILYPESASITQA